MAELTLGLPSTPPGSFKSFFFSGLGEEDGDKLQSCLAALEDERKKIEVFRRELPLCMQLMNDAIEALKSHLKSPPIRFEEFIPSKPDDSPRTVAIDLEKPSWMSQAQLWSPSTENPSRPQAQRLVLNSNSGAFSPFVRRNTSTSSSEEPSVSRSSDTPSPTPQQPIQQHQAQDQQQQQQHQHHQQQQNQIQAESDKSIGSNNGMNSSGGGINNQRKARRCWSADLHKRFLNALEQLGGSQVATPKLIREIMKVDGLTNDEVKSHLQKYRLHTRRPAQRSEAPPVVIWVPAEYAQHQKCQVPGLSTFFAQQQQQEQQHQQQQTSEVLEPEKVSNSHSTSSGSESEKLHHEEIDDGDVTETEDSSGGKVVDEAEEMKS